MACIIRSQSGMNSILWSFNSCDPDLDVICHVFYRYWENEKVRLAYRPVHMNTLDDEIESFPPKARVY